jgi:4'-phosphopantetheinyl transferase
MQILSSTAHVWVFSHDQPPSVADKLMPLLTLEEQHRAAQFQDEVHRRRFVVRRGELRHLLSRYTHQVPHEITFTKGTHGKLALTGREVEFSVSHSEEWVAVAVTRSPIGIDIEVNRPLVQLQQVARDHFSPHEQAQLFALADEEQQAAFYRMWTCKEAIIKADGRGIQIPLDGFDVPLSPDVSFAPIHSTDPTLHGWRLSDVSSPYFVGALATSEVTTNLLTNLHLPFYTH